MEMWSERQSASLVCVAVAALAAATVSARPPGSAQDVKDARDPATLERFRGYYIASYKAKASHDARFCVRVPKARAKVKGRYWRFTYRRPRGAKPASGDEVRSHYRDLFKKAHAAPLCESPPDLDARLVRDGVATWVHLRAFAPGDSYELEIVESEAR